MIRYILLILFTFFMINAMAKTYVQEGIDSENLTPVEVKQIIESRKNLKALKKSKASEEELIKASREHIRMTVELRNN